VNEPGPPLYSRIVSRSPVYYGWVVLVAAIVGLAASMPGQTSGISVFLDYIIDDLGVSRSGVSTVYALATVAGSLALPFVGRYIDRRGPRRSVVVFTIAFALACVLVSLAGTLLALFAVFTLIRALGAGALGLVSMNSVNIWFVRRRGFAVGLAGAGFAVALAVIPGAMDALISRVGWREAWVVMGVLVAVVMLPVGGGFFRGHPELYGLTPDGGRTGGRTPVANERDYDLAEARRTLTFWLYVGGGFLSSALATGLVFHHYSIMDASGVGRTTASTMFATFGIGTAVAGLVAGYLMDRIPPRFLLSACTGLVGVGMLVATRVSTPGQVLAYGALFGAMNGISTAVFSSVFAYYFGRRHIGAITGVVSTILVAASAAGPVLLAVGFDATGSYEPILTASAVVPLGLALVIPFLVLKREGVIR
jgi:MFS transporter, OFA family, oxalate/formate antiporter